jgi:hypothetical protein
MLASPLASRKNVLQRLNFMAGLKLKRQCCTMLVLMSGKERAYGVAANGGRSNRLADGEN